MFDLTKWWQSRTTNRPLRFSNRVVLSFENLETRTLLSSGVIQTTLFDGPLSAVAIVAEPINLNATSAQTQQTLSDVVPGGSSSRVLPARYAQPDPVSQLALPDPFGLRMLHQLDRMVTALMNFEMGLLNGAFGTNSDAGQALETPGLNTGNAATATADGMAAIRITTPLQLQPVTDPNTGLTSLQIQLTNPNTTTTTTGTTTNTASTTPLQLLNQGNSNGFVGPEGGSARQSRAPIQSGSPSNGNTGPGGQQVTNNTPPAGNAAPTVLSPDLARNASPGSLPSTTSGILPGQGTTGGTLVGGQLLLPGVATTPLTPAQQIQAGIVNTADPYARFEQTILTKEGFKTASGEETPIPPRNNQQNPVRAFGAFEEEEDLDLLDPSQVGSDDQAALHRHKTDTFFADSALMGEDQGWAHGNSVALAGAMLILGGFWGVQIQKNEERKRRQSVFATLRKWLRR